MADIRINALATTASSTASDDFLAVDGSANGTRKLNAYSPTFGGNLTVSGGTVTSGTGTLTLNSSANTVVLQSAGTTALTLDTSQVASFNRGGSPTWQTASTLRANGSSSGALEVNTNNGTNLIQFASGSTYQGNILTTDTGATLRFTAGTSMALLLTASDSSTKGVKIDTNGNFLLYNSASVPAANPTGGGLLYVEGGALKYRGSSGTVTTIANA